MNRGLRPRLASASLAAVLTLALAHSPASALSFTVGGAPADGGQALGAVAKAAGAIKNSGATIANSTAVAPRWFRRKRRRRRA